MNKIIGSLISLVIAFLPFSASAYEKWSAPTPPEMSIEEIALADAELLPGVVEKTKVVYASDFYRQHPDQKKDNGELGFWVEARTASGDTPSEVTVYYEKSLTDSISAYAVFYKDADGYREYYAGPAFKLTDWLQVGIAFGRELEVETPSAARRAAFISIDRETFSVYATLEDGGSGPWHKGIVLYKISETFRAGLMKDSLVGSGPRVEYDILDNVQVWSALLRNRDTKETAAFFAVNFSF